MTTRAEFLGVGELHGGIERAPEQNAADEAADGQKPQAEVHAGAADHRPVALEKCQHDGSLVPHKAASVFLGGLAPDCDRMDFRIRASTSMKVLFTSGRTASWLTWHCMQK
jgi:hypothetical protein